MSRARAILSAAFRLIRQTIEEFVDDDGPLVAAGLAFYAILSLAPLLALVVLLGGPMLGEERMRQQVVAETRGFAGQQAAETVGQLLERASQPSFDSVSAVVGLLVLAFGATRVFAHVQRALNKVWDVKVPTRGRVARSLWRVTRKRLMSATMILGLVVLLTASLLVGAAIELVASAWPAVLGSKGVFRVMDLSATFGMGTVLFALVFRYLPDARIAYRDVSIGAMVTAALFVMGKFLIALYLGQRSLGSAYGAASSVILLLVWVYYCCTIFLIGAEFTEVYAKLHGSGIQPEEHAVRVFRQHGSGAGTGND